MADTLRSLAGDRFLASDVIAGLHPPLTPEELVLDRYVFLPHARTGVAAALTAPFDWSLPIRASVEMRMPVIDDRGPLDAEMTVHVYGPADVTEIDQRQVIRQFPRADAADAEVDDLVHVEFDRPDLPWLFTPAGPDAAGRLVPWITLVVAERRFVEWGPTRGGARVAKIRRDQLQPLGDAWAWAHAQVMGARGAAAEVPPTLEQRLSPNNAAHNLSRLVCPRRLAPRTAYVACVVPTFLAGVRAGLGLASPPTLEPAWGTSTNFAAGNRLDWVELPVYVTWSFATGEDGNFESLARKLKPAVAPPGVGRRRVDATQPWPERTLGADDPGAEIVVTGAVVSPQAPDPGPPERWPTEERQHWAPEVTAELAARLNRPDEQAHAPDPGPPLVGPPLYGGTHAREPRVDADDPTQPPWFQTLNLDPRHRIAAGLGSRVVQAEQEDLMLAAWNQVGGIEAANRALRMAQLARHVSASLHRRHLSRLPDAALVPVTERVHAKVLDEPGRSVWATVRSSSLPPAVTSGAFRRLARSRGPVVRAAVQAAGLVDQLTVRPDRFTTDWVRTYTHPDGVRGLSERAAALVTDEVAARVLPGADRQALLTAWSGELGSAAGPDRLDPARLQALPAPDTVDLGREVTGGLVRYLVGLMPDDREIDGNAEAAVTAATVAQLVQSAAGMASQIGVGEVEILRVDARRLRLDGRARGRGPGTVIVPVEGFGAYAERALETVRRVNDRIPFDDLRRNGDLLGEAMVRTLRLSGRTVLDGLAAIGAKAVHGDAFAEPARSRVNVPALDLTAKLDPGLTVTNRVRARLTHGTGRTPGWLRPGWFDDLFIEPVMAHPRFAYPMYEPLHRYDPEWMIPGLGLIPRPDMATLLQTNNRFIEAYLVGLNHEMARELLWREFPTDQRGTYFSSFWTGGPELVADLHERPWRSGPLGSHVKPELDGQLVFLVRGDLVRRYPGVVAHAVREAGRDNGIPRFEAGSPVRTLFHVHLPPNVLLVGFGMPRERIDTPGETWWFTLSENPTEPRFGLDPSRPGQARSRDSLIWDDFGVPFGGFLTAARGGDVAYEGSRWGESSASVAYLLFQLPARAAFLGTRMVQGALR